MGWLGQKVITTWVDKLCTGRHGVLDGSSSCQVGCSAVAKAFKPLMRSSPSPSLPAAAPPSPAQPRRRVGAAVAPLLCGAGLAHAV